MDQQRLPYRLCARGADAGRDDRPRRRACDLRGGVGAWRDRRRWLRLVRARLLQRLYLPCDRLNGAGGDVHAGPADSDRTPCAACAHPFGAILHRDVRSGCEPVVLDKRMGGAALRMVGCVLGGRNRVGCCRRARSPRDRRDSARARPRWPAARHPLDFRPVLRNRAALAYVLAYGGHSLELFGFRAWLPAYLLFAWTRLGNGPPGSRITDWAMVITVTSLPASIIGAEVAMRRSRSRLIRLVAGASALIGLCTVVVGRLSFAAAVTALFAYAAAISADSGALTAGAVAVARPGEQGATLAVYSLVGFVGGALGPLGAGVALGLGGGLSALTAWYLAFAAVAGGSIVAAVAISFAPLTSSVSA